MNTDKYNFHCESEFDTVLIMLAVVTVTVWLLAVTL